MSFRFHDRFFYPRPAIIVDEARTNRRGCKTEAIAYKKEKEKEKKEDICDQWERNYSDDQLHVFTGSHGRLLKRLIVEWERC